ncbi:MAG: NTP transferase domain-containing protein, partial [Acidobacteriota bacterium]
QSVNFQFSGFGDSRRFLPKIGNSRSDPASVILAAGKSRRMRSPKPLLEFQGKSFLRHIIDAHRMASLPVYVVLGEDRHCIEQSVDLSDASVLVNPDPSRGQLSSLHTALERLTDREALVVHPVDHPLVRSQTIQELIDHFRRVSDCILIPEFQGRKGHPVLFPSRFYPDLKRAPLEEGARWVVHQNPESELRVPVDDPGVVQNINTPAQFEKLSAPDRSSQ